MRQYCIIYSTCICFASISVNLFAASFRMDTTNTMKFSLATSTTPTKPNPIQCLLYLTEYKVIYSEYFLSIRNITKNFLKLLRLFAVVIGILMCAFAQQATQKRSGFFLVEMSKAQQKIHIVFIALLKQLQIIDADNFMFLSHIIRSFLVFL